MPSLPRPRLEGRANPAMIGQDRSAFGKGNMVPPKLSSGSVNARNRSVEGDRKARAKAARLMVRKSRGEGDAEVEG